MTNLIAYMPVLNRQYLEWLEKHQPFKLYLVSQYLAESLIPQLGRNMIAVSEGKIAVMIKSLGLTGSVSFLDPALTPFGEELIMPDEDISRQIASEYLHYDPLYMSITFEPIWARWDMSAVKRQEPVIPDLEVSVRKIDKLRMEAANKLAQKSPDWWRQIGALAFRGDEFLAVAYNKHYPTEYETMIFGDPRIVFQAGDPAGAEVYLSLHAERGIIATCAKEGVALKGASVYVTTFPCGDCARMLAACQIKELLFQEGYSVLKGFETLKAAGVQIAKVN